MSVLRTRHPSSTSVCGDNQGGHQSFGVQSFYWGFITDTWLIESLAMPLNSVQSSFFPRLISSGPKPQPSNHTIGLSSVALEACHIEQRHFCPSKGLELTSQEQGTDTSQILFITHLQNV